MRRGRVSVAFLASGLAVTAFAFAAPAARAADRDCTTSDFSNQADAQSYFESKGGPDSDPDRLDGNRDGKACEALPCPCAGPGGSRPRPRPRRRRRVVFTARVTAVVDGDTIKVRRGWKRYTARLIGIDTPETRRPGRPVECGGREATASMLQLGFTRPRDTNGDGLVDRRGGRGRRVVVRTDPTQARRDRYRRLLAYVRAGRRDFGLGQLNRGWAKVYVFRRRFERYRRYQAAARSAKGAKRGVWGRCGGRFHRPASGFVDRDCADFSSQAEAQAFFEANGGPSQDRHGLDPDGDGVACEAA